MNVLISNMSPNLNSICRGLLFGCVSGVKFITLSVILRTQTSGPIMHRVSAAPKAYGKLIGRQYASARNCKLCLSLNRTVQYQLALNKSKRLFSRLVGSIDQQEDMKSQCWSG
ncbi:hypothetical protein BDR03DRAFT_187968 [Suillus americanus]|nr:hypothetical protein BDR03DRAFT_187968 [Suillus americanus]